MGTVWGFQSLAERHQPVSLHSGAEFTRLSWGHTVQHDAVQKYGLVCRSISTVNVDLNISRPQPRGLMVRVSAY